MAITQNIFPQNSDSGSSAATSITVTSPDNTIVQIGSSTIVDNNLNVELEANINALIPSYDTYNDLPDPNTLPAGSCASVKQGINNLNRFEPSGIYQIVETSIKYWNYLGEYIDNHTIIYNNVYKVNTGTTANKIVQLDNNAKIPAVDASQTTIGTIIPENNPIVDNDNLNTTANKLQGQINNALKPISPAVNNNLVSMTSFGSLKNSGFGINNSNPFVNPSNTQIADAQSTYNLITSLASGSNGLQPVVLYFDTNQTLSGLPTQNGYTCVDNDRVICANQTNTAENLIYNVHSGAWTIATDSQKVNGLLGAWTEIIKGTYNNNYTYLVNITPASGDVTPTSVTWSTPVPAGLYQAGAGLNLTGSVFSIADNGVTNLKLNTTGANTYKGNNTNATANVSDIPTNNAFNQSFETNTSNIKMDGIANIGTSNNIPRADHVHPSDTSKQNLISLATPDNIVTTNVNGQVLDSGKKFSINVNLDENSDDNIPTEAVVKYNVDYLNNRISNLPIGAGQGAVYYLTNDANGSYLTLSNIPKNGVDDFLFVTVNNTSPRQLLGAFATALPLNKTILDAGIWEFNIWCLANYTQETTYIDAEVYTLSNTNTETLLFEINNNKNIGSLSPIVYSLSTTENSYTILPTDKLLIKFYADTTRNQDVIVVMYYNSQNYYSHMHTPIVVSHNQLSGLNGGDGANEYYHLTQNQYNNVINQATTTQNGYLASTDFTTFNNKQNALTNPITSSSATPTANQLSVFNATGTQVTPTTILPTSAIPVFTNDVTSAGGSTILTIANNAVTNAKQAQMATNTIKGNNTGVTANANDLTTTQVNTMLETFNNVYYVSPNGLDTNTGKSLNTSVKTLAQALILAGNSGVQIVIMPGIYNENTTITDQNVTITSSNRELGGIINFTGTITVNHSASSVRLSGLNINNLVHSGAGSLYADELNTTTFNKTGTGYVEMSSSDMQGSSNNGTITITGAGIILFVNKCNLGALTINNASAIVNLINNTNSFPITLTSGTLGINNTPVYSSSATTSAVTVASGAICYITNSTMLTPTNSNARITISSGSFYSLNNVIYDKTNSTLSGTVITRTGYSDSMEFTTALPITSGGTGSGVRQTAINNLTGDVTSGQYLRGNGTNVVMSTIQANDVPTLNQNTTGTANSVTGTNVITNTNLAQMATNTIKGNNTGVTANASDLTGTQVTAILNNFVGDSGSGGTKGLVPAPVAGDGSAGKYLDALGNWSVPTGGGSSTSIPIGTIIQNISPAVNGYLLCDGTSYNRTDYNSLFNLLNTSKGTATMTIATPTVITLNNHGLTTGQKIYFTTTGALPTGLTANTTYWVNVLTIATFNLATSYANLIAGIYIATSGTQSGVHTAFLTIASVSSATTFNTPDYRGRVLANANASNGVGKFTGAETHTLTTGELPAHSHGITGDGGSGIGSSTSTDRVLVNTDGTPQDVYVKNTQNAGSGQSHNNMQPTEFVYFHIKF